MKKNAFLDFLLSASEIVHIVLLWFCFVLRWIKKDVKMFLQSCLFCRFNQPKTCWLLRMLTWTHFSLEDKFTPEKGPKTLPRKLPRPVLVGIRGALTKKLLSLLNCDPQKAIRHPVVYLCQTPRSFLLRRGVLVESRRALAAFARGSQWRTPNKGVAYLKSIFQGAPFCPWSLGAKKSSFDPKGFPFMSIRFATMWFG